MAASTAAFAALPAPTFLFFAGPVQPQLLTDT